MDFCSKSSGFADFGSTVDRGSAVNIGTDSRLCLSIDVLNLGLKRNLDHRSFFTGGLVDMLMTTFLFSYEAHLNSGVRLLLELYCVIVIKHVAFFTIWVKLTKAFTFTA